MFTCGPRPHATDHNFRTPVRKSRNNEKIIFWSWIGFCQTQVRSSKVLNESKYSIPLVRFAFDNVLLKNPSFFNFHHISFCVEPSLMFCRVAESCVGGNDKTDRRYPAHLPTKLKRQNNLAQNHPIHPITCIGHSRLPIVIEFNFVKERKNGKRKGCFNSYFNVSVISDRPSEFLNTRLRIGTQKLTPAANLTKLKCFVRKS